MNNEIKIKQLLNRLLIYRGNAELNKWQPEDILTIEDVWILLDYITNLQEENENRISESLSYDLAVARVKELEYRIDKAIEYINGWQKFPNTNGSTHNELHNLLNILEERDKYFQEI